MVAVEPDLNAFEQSVDNFRVSPWWKCIHGVNTRIQTFLPHTDATKAEQILDLSTKYDLIVSNPPYFPAVNHGKHCEPKKVSDLARDQEMINTPLLGQRKLARQQISSLKLRLNLNSAVNRAAIF